MWLNFTIICMNAKQVPIGSTKLHSINQSESRNLKQPRTMSVPSNKIRQKVWFYCVSMFTISIVCKETILVVELQLQNTTYLCLYLSN